MDSVSHSSSIPRNGGVDSDQHYVRIGNPPIHPGATRAPMPRYYALPDRRRIERVPRPPLLSPPTESFPGVMFSVNGFPGVRVRDILKDTVTIDSADDAVLGERGWRMTVINLEWPGYEHRSLHNSNPMKARIDVCPDGMDITRQDFARQICILLFKFHKVISKHPIAVEYEKWALTTGPEGIRVADIVLLSAHYYRNVWVPELYVIE